MVHRAQHPPLYLHSFRSHMQDRSTSSHTLLILPNVSLRTPVATVTGALSLECLDSASHIVNGREAYLVCCIEGHSFPIDPTVPIIISYDGEGKRTYRFRHCSNAEKAPTPSEVVITITMYTEDAETLDIVLSQYGSGVVRHRDGHDDGHDSQSRTQPPPSDQHTTESTDGNTHSAVHINDPSLRGRLVLMDESSGEVVGELPERLSFKEDPALISGEKQKQKGEEVGPVVLELPPDMYDAYTSGKGLPVDVIGENLAETRDVFVRAIPEEEQDWLTTGATVISQVISGSTSLFLSGISTASSYYIKHSAPYVPPPQSPSPVSRPRTPTALTHAHTFTDQAAKASAVTVTYVGKFIRAAVGVEDTPSEPSTPPEPLPPAIVNPSYSVYKPKPRTPTARSKEGSPNLSHSRNTSSGNSPRPQSPEHKPLPTRDRLILSATLVLKTVDDSAKRMFDVSSESLGAVIGHKYGPEARESTHLATHTARNIVLVYVDVSGFARRALITKTGKEFVKARFNSSKAETQGVDVSVLQHPASSLIENEKNGVDSGEGPS